MFVFLWTDYLFKFLIIGSAGVGKSCILHQFMEGKCNYNCFILHSLSQDQHDNLLSSVQKFIGSWIGTILSHYIRSFLDHLSTYILLYLYLSMFFISLYTIIIKVYIQILDLFSNIKKVGDSHYDLYLTSTFAVANTTVCIW